MTRAEKQRRAENADKENSDDPSIDAKTKPEEAKKNPSSSKKPSTPKSVIEELENGDAVLEIENKKAKKSKKAKKEKKDKDEKP